MNRAASIAATLATLLALSAYGQDATVTLERVDSSSGATHSSVAAGGPALPVPATVTGPLPPARPEAIGPLVDPGRADGAPAPRARTARGDVLDVPRMNQFTGGGRYPRAYCGPTSLRMVLGFFGIRIDADTAAKGVYIRGRGASHEGMVRKLRSLGLKADLGRSRSLAALKAAVGRGHPVIINVRGDYGPRRTAGHIVVVVGFDRQGNPILNDPATGGRHVAPARKLLSAWRGLMIEASR